MDVRCKILRNATRLFAAHGFEGTSLSEIANAVGIRKPSLLYHFPSKEELRLAVLDELLERWNDVLPRLLMAAVGGELRFEAVLREGMTFFSEDPDRARLLLREMLDRPEDMRQRMDAYVRPWVGAVAECIRRGQHTGEVHQDLDPEAYVLQITMLLLSGMATAPCLVDSLLRSEGSAEPLERHMRELLRIARCSLFSETSGDASLEVSALALRLRQGEHEKGL